MVDRLKNNNFGRDEAKIVDMQIKDTCNGKWLIDLNNNFGRVKAKNVDL